MALSKVLFQRHLLACRALQANEEIGLIFSPILWHHEIPVAARRARPVNDY